MTPEAARRGRRGANNKNGGKLLTAAKEDFRVTEELIGAAADGGDRQLGPLDLTGIPTKQAQTPSVAQENQQQLQQGGADPHGGNTMGRQPTQGN